MNILSKTSFSSFDYPMEVKRLVICDFDETYMPYSKDKKRSCGIYELETFINSNTEKLSLLIGWVTGSSLKAVIRKSQNHINKYPHFIASSLGSEFYWLKNGKIQESEEWNKQIEDSGFIKENIKCITESLQNKKILLVKQVDDYQGKYMESFYYYMSDKTEKDILEIKETASKYQIKSHITPCNPAAGDPENCYDVQFMPKCCGKKEVLCFLLKKFNLDIQNTWAFGDSFNDFDILSSVGNPYLVANADLNLKKQMPKAILKGEYCHGIKESLINLLS